MVRFRLFRQIALRRSWASSHGGLATVCVLAALIHIQLHAVWINAEAGKAFTFKSEEDFVSAVREFEGAHCNFNGFTSPVVDRYGSATERKDDNGQTVRSREDLHDCSSKSK